MSHPSGVFSLHPSGVPYRHPSGVFGGGESEPVYVVTRKDFDTTTGYYNYRLFRINGKTGQVVWQKDLSTDYEDETYDRTEISNFSEEFHLWGAQKQLICVMNFWRKDRSAVDQRLTQIGPDGSILSRGPILNPLEATVYTTLDASEKFVLLGKTNVFDREANVSNIYGDPYSKYVHPESTAIDVNGDTWRNYTQNVNNEILFGIKKSTDSDPIYVDITVGISNPDFDSVGLSRYGCISSGQNDVLLPIQAIISPTGAPSYSLWGGISIPIDTPPGSTISYTISESNTVEADFYRYAPRFKSADPVIVARIMPTESEDGIAIVQRGVTPDPEAATTSRAVCAKVEWEVYIPGACGFDGTIIAGGGKIEIDGSVDTSKNLVCYTHMDDSSTVRWSTFIGDPGDYVEAVIASG